MLLIYFNSNNIYCDGLFNKALKGILTPDTPTTIQMNIDPLTKTIVCTAGVCVIGLCGYKAYELMNDKGPTNQDLINHMDKKFHNLHQTIINVNNENKIFISNETKNLQDLVANSFTVQTTGEINLITQVEKNIINHLNKNMDKISDESKVALSHILNSQSKFEDIVVKNINNSMSKLEKDIMQLKIPESSELDKELLDNVINQIHKTMEDTSNIKTNPQDLINNSINTINNPSISSNFVSPIPLTSTVLNPRYMTNNPIIQNLFDQVKKNAEIKINLNLANSTLELEEKEEKVKFNNSDILRNKMYELIEFDTNKIVFQSTSHSSIPGIITTASRTGKFIMNNIPTKETLLVLLGICELAYSSPVTTVLKQLGYSLGKINEIFSYKPDSTKSYKVGKNINEILSDFLKGISNSK
jgi:hypothetical protein